MKGFLVLLIATFLLIIPACDTSEVRDYYQIKIYNLETEAQESFMDNYLGNALVPALHRAGIEKVGVFKSIDGRNEDKKFILLFTPFKSFADIEKLDGILANDETYQNDG